MLSTLSHWLILLLVVFGVVAIFWIAVRQLNVTIPQWVIQIFWIIVVVVVGVLAIRLLMGLV